MYSIYIYIYVCIYSFMQETFTLHGPGPGPGLARPGLARSCPAPHTTPLLYIYHRTLSYIMLYCSILSDSQCPMICSPTRSPTGLARGCLALDIVQASLISETVKKLQKCLMLVHCCQASSPTVQLRTDL